MIDEGRGIDDFLNIRHVFVLHKQVSNGSFTIQYK